ncbi:MAG: lipid-transfer protein [Chitinophagaceae bacterium]|nr:lipid-transfer protein [Rubrivivax sp.]
MSNSNAVWVAGVGMVPFKKPGAAEPYDSMGAEAARMALRDAGLDYADVQQAYVGYVYGDSTSGQQALYKVGLTGIPIVNVNNACATGSTALFLARQAVAHGVCDVALALGFEQMNPGALGVQSTDRPSIMGKQLEHARESIAWNDEVPVAALLFGSAGEEHQRLHGTRAETFGRISVKARQHAARNPLAIFRETLTLEEVMASKQIYGPLTRFQCCPPTCGAAAAVIVSEAYARRKGLTGQAVEIVAQAMTTDPEATLQGHSMIRVVGYEMARDAGAQVYAQAGIGPLEVDVCELHDCFTTNELLTYEALGLAPAGGGEKFVMDGDNTYGGQVVTNPSGGLLSKGHPLGATGLAQCAELTWQLRGQAQARQVDDARIALQHNLGLGGACVVTMYRK